MCNNYATHHHGYFYAFFSSLNDEGRSVHFPIDQIQEVAVLEVRTSIAGQAEGKSLGQ